MSKDYIIPTGDHTKEVYDVLQAVITESRKTVASKKAKPAKGGDKYATMGAALLEAVGGIDNIKIVDNCATRLRLTVNDNVKNVDDAKIKAAGAYGIKRLGSQGLQIIVGTDVEHVANVVHELTGK